ncbi:MAG: lamin tail domain-containing protein [Verrucomicrobiota bacterium]
MKKFPLLCVPLLLSLLASARADSVVVFNEIMYHPDTAGEPAGEWVELRNQMGVDVDISHWRLADAVDYTFPAGTVIPAGGLLVVAEIPSGLTAAGVTGAMGPWSGKLNNSGEKIELRNNNSRVMDEAEYNNRGGWPVAADGGGPSLARKAKFLNGEKAASWASSRKSGGTPGADNFPAAAPPETAPPLVINEAGLTRIEIMNPGTAAVSTAGCRLQAAGGPAAALPDQMIPPGGWLSVDFATGTDQPVLLFAADGTTCLDSVLVREKPRARFPDGSGPWRYATTETPGAANAVTLRNEIVISEIMYDHPDSSLLPAGSPQPGQWLELHNKSAAAVDLSGWRMDGGITFTFPAGATLAAGGYGVLVQNPAAFATGHPLPANAVFGPWEGKLSHSADTLILEDPAGNPADEVSFFSEGRWPAGANAGGSSLELRQADADNNIAESWAASDESGKAAWQTFTWRGPNKPSQTGEPVLWRELNLLLVDGPGECLVDDVKLTDTTTGNDLIQNGSFSDGASHWRLLGTHRHSRVEPEPGNAGNSVLHVIAAGPGEYQGNQIESTFLNNQALVANREYEISLRARWISGGGRLNTRAYFNRLPRTNLLNVVSNGGTPGAPNSRTVANAGPAYRSLSHSPVVPAANQAVTVSVEAADPQGVAALSLKYAVAGGAWQTVAMSPAGGGTGTAAAFTGVIPGQASGAVQFYIEGADGSGAVSYFPAAGVDSRAMYKVQDNLATGTMPKFRVVMKPADATFLHTAVNTLSNDFLPCTIIAEENDVYYNAGIRLKGSFVGRNVARAGFTVSFNSDRLFRGIHDKVAIDRSQHAALGQGEIILKHMAGAAGGIPSMYDDLARFIHPLTTYTGKCQMRLTGFDDDYLDTQYPDGADGTMFEMEVIRWATQTVDSKPESLKLPPGSGAGDGYQNYDVADYGTDKEAYRWTMLQSKSRSRDDYTRIVDMSRMFSKTGTAFDVEATQRLDKEEWLRTLAFQSLVGTADSVFTGSNIHNFRLYIRPGDGRALYMPWDWDSAYQLSSTAAVVGGGNFAKVVTSTPDNRRRYYWQLNDLVKSVFNTAYMTRWTQHYGTVAGESYSGILSYISSRAAYVRTQVPSTTAFTSTAGAVADGGILTLTGTANIDVLNLEVNGLIYQPVWTSNTAWRLSVPLAAGSSTLTIKGLDKNGTALTGAASSLTVENTSGPASWPALRISEWMAENTSAVTDPADGKNDDWLELHNPTEQPVDLSGWRLSDNPATPALFTVPAGWSIPAKGFLLIWADEETAQNPAAPAAGNALHAGFKLSKDGETLRLSTPDGREIDRVTFGAQTADRSEGRAPEGDPAAATALTLPSPGAANVLTRFLRLSLTAAAPEVEITTTPGWNYLPETSADLKTWLPAAPAATPAAGTTLALPVPVMDGTRKYLRVRVSR